MVKSGETLVVTRAVEAFGSTARRYGPGERHVVGTREMPLETAHAGLQSGWLEKETRPPMDRADKTPTKDRATKPTTRPQGERKTAQVPKAPKTR